MMATLAFNELSISNIWLMHIMSLVSFYTPRKHQQTSAFVFSGGIERGQWYEMGYMKGSLYKWSVLLWYGNSYQLKASFLKRLPKVSFNKNNENYEQWKKVVTFPDDIYLFKVNNKNTRTKCEICSKLRMKTSERRHSKQPKWVSALDGFALKPFFTYIKTNFTKTTRLKLVKA